MVKQQAATAGKVGADRPRECRKKRNFVLGRRLFTPAFVAAAFVFTLGFSIPAHANTSDTTIGVPLVNPAQALPTDNVTITVAVTCDNPNGGHDGGDGHGGCAQGVAGDDATRGSVEFFAYLPAGLASCDADPGAPISLGAADNDGTDGWSVTFTPDGIALVPGEVYFIRIEYTGFEDETFDSDLNSGCAALATLEVEESPLVQKVFVSGPSLVDETTDVLGADTNPDPNDLGPDGGVIYIGLTVPQYFVFNIVINNDGVGAVDIVVSDVVGADFDLSAPLDSDPNGDQTCSPISSQPPNGDTPKEPEFIDIAVDAGETCTVEVHVVTVENPGGGNNLFEPTGVRMVGETTGNGDPIFDTYTLNEGVKVFDASDGADSGERIIGPVGSLQLTPIFPAP